MLKIAVTVDDADAGGRLDSVLTARLAGSGEVSEQGIAISRSKVERWIKDGRVTVGGRSALRPSLPVTAGQAIEVSIPLDPLPHLSPSASVPFAVIFEDEDILIIDKPAGVVVHPGAGQKDETLVNGLVHYFGGSLPRIGDALRPGIVHRLDKDTSGIMAVAKTERAFAALAAQFKPPRTIARNYSALTARLPQPVGKSPAGVIDAAIGRHPVKRTKMAVRADGKQAQTSWRAAEILRFGCLLDVKIETGRTHQIRVHLAAAKSPIIGDPVYGPPLRDLPAEIRPAVRVLGRQALHARTLSFLHPRTGERVEFSAPLPEDMRKLIDSMRGGGQ